MIRKILPVGRRGTVNIVVPVTNPELLIEACLIGTHVWYSPSILVTHVENLKLLMKWIVV